MAARPGDYTHFKSIVPLNRVSIGTKQWRYYDSGPKSAPPLICLPGTAGTADVFYKQILSLSSKGYRVIAADAPPVWSHQEWVNSFEKFLDTIGVHHVHIYGTSLGGFLGQLFAHYRPRRVKSLVLSNTFVDTREFAAATTWSALINYTPEFLLKRYILSGIQDGPQEPLIADSIDFIVSQLETLSREELASRLTLNTAVGAIGQILVPDSAITVMDGLSRPALRLGLASREAGGLFLLPFLISQQAQVGQHTQVSREQHGAQTNDYCAIPQALRDEVGARYVGARKASLKTGGDFPFLSRPDEVNLHLQLHLRRVGVEGVVVTREPTSKDRSGDSARGEGGINSPPGMPPARGGGPGEDSSPSSSSSSTYEVNGQQVMLRVESTWKLNMSLPASSLSATEWKGLKSTDISLWLFVLYPCHADTSIALANSPVTILQLAACVWTASKQWYLLIVMCCLLLKYDSPPQATYLPESTCRSLYRMRISTRCVY